MRLRVLGPTELVGPDGPVRVTAKPRALLAVLAIRRGDVASADELVDALWGESPPDSAAKLIQVYVSQLRKLLPAGVGISTRGAGYALDMASEELDAAAFEHMAATGADAIRNDNPALAAATLRRALDLWRGPALADVRYEAWAAPEAERLEALRDLSLERRLDADLRLGRHAEVLPELRALAGADPTRESIVALAMLAAHRTGATADALALFDAATAALDEELGTEPGPELRELRARIVRHEPSLAAPVAGARSGAAVALPMPPNALLGRDRELRELVALLSRPGVRLVTLTGAGGSGKSRLALEVARAMDGELADGAALVELASLADPDLVPIVIAQTLGVEPGLDAEASLRHALATRDQMLVVDNLEHLRDAGPGLVRLLAAAPGLRLLVTSRVVLHLSGEHVVPVGPLAPSDAAELFVERAVASEPSFAVGAELPFVQEICARVDGLPLAIELAAARVRSLGLAGVRDRLVSRLALLTGGPRDLPARQRTLRETLAWSVNLLAPPAASSLGALAVFPATCSLESAAIVAGTDDEILAELVDHHLVEAVDIDDERRVRLLETVREYGYELLGEGRGVVESRLVDRMVDLVERAELMQALTTEKLRRFDAEQDALRAAFDLAARDEEPRRELALAAGFWRYWWTRGHLIEARARLDGIIERRGLVPTRDGIRTVRASASILWSLGEYDAARARVEQALPVAEAIDDRLEQHACHNLLGVIANSLDDLSSSESHLLRSIELAEGIGHHDLALTAVTNLGITYLSAGRHDDARSRLQAVLEYRERHNSVEGVAFAHTNLGEVEFEAGRLDEAERHFTSALAGFGEVGFQSRIANIHQDLAAVEARTGRSEAAARRLGQAATLLGETGWGADGTGLAARAIEEARAALGDERFEALFREGAAIRPGR